MSSTSTTTSLGNPVVQNLPERESEREREREKGASEPKFSMEMVRRKREEVCISQTMLGLWKWFSQVVQPYFLGKIYQVSGAMLFFRAD